MTPDCHISDDEGSCRMEGQDEQRQQGDVHTQQHLRHHLSEQTAQGPAMETVYMQEAASNFGLQHQTSQGTTVAKVASGLVSGVLLPGVIYHRRPEHPFPQRRYAALSNQPISEADCGGDVVEPNTGRVYGHIVQMARYSDVQVVYVVSVADALWDVNRQFDEEARLATTWYIKQKQGLTGCPRQEVVPPQTGHVHFEDDEKHYTPPTSFAFDANSGRLSSRSASSRSPSTESLKPRSPPTSQRPLQVQFDYYKASGLPGDGQCDSAGSLGVAGGDGAQFDLQRAGADGLDFADSEIPISALLPDRKCPFQTCEYHTKGFVRKHDLVRHIITHYDGRLYCGFCPDGLTKSFGRPFLRVEPLKRHLAAVHDAAKFRKTQNTTEAYLRDRIREHGSVGAGHCTICVRSFASAAELYGHIEGCVVQLLLLRAREDNGFSVPQNGAAMFQSSMGSMGMEEAGWNASTYMLATGVAGTVAYGGH